MPKSSFNVLLFRLQAAIHDKDQEVLVLEASFFFRKSFCAEPIPFFEQKNSSPSLNANEVAVIISVLLLLEMP